MLFFKNSICDQHIINSVGFQVTIYHSQISGYSTTHTLDAVFIIGGKNIQDDKLAEKSMKIVAQFKNDQWEKLDDLKQGRFAHGSINVAGQTFIFGGITVGGAE